VCARLPAALSGLRDDPKEVKPGGTTKEELAAGRNMFALESYTPAERRVCEANSEP
jgi:hypothetical protein